MSLKKMTSPYNKLGPVVQKFRVWLGLPLGAAYGLLLLLGVFFAVLQGKDFELYVYLAMLVVILRGFWLPEVIVHENGIRLLRLYGYRAIKWKEIENIEVGYITSIRLLNGKAYEFSTSSLSDDDDKARIITLIRKLFPEFDIKIADEQVGQRRRVKVDIVAAVLVGIAFMFCLAATLLMFGRLDSSVFPAIVAWAAFVLSLAVAGKSRVQRQQRLMALCACVLAGGAFAYYFTLMA